MEFELIGESEGAMNGYLGPQHANEVKVGVNHRIAKSSTRGQLHFSREVTSRARKEYQNTVSLMSVVDRIYNLCPIFSLALLEHTTIQAWWH